MLEIIPREGSFPDLNIIEQASVARRASVGPRGCVGLEPELAETWALRQYPEVGDSDRQSTKRLSGTARHPAVAC